MRPVLLLLEALGRVVLLVLGRVAVVVVLPVVPGVGRTLVLVDGLAVFVVAPGLVVLLPMVGRVVLPPLRLLVLPEAPVVPVLLPPGCPLVR